MSAAKTIRDGSLGKKSLRLVEMNNMFFGLADGKLCVEGNNADQVWQQLHTEAGKSSANYFGFDGAISRFLSFFPDGFHSESYEEHERNYKLAAKEKLDSLAPLQKALTENGLAEAILSVYRSTNMLSPYEKTWLQDVLRGDNADAVIRAIAAFTQNANRQTLAHLEAKLKPHDCAKWTIVTYLPYLWQPECHMFLKPNVTKDFADRVGHPFAALYEAGLNFDVYASLLDMVSRTNQEIKKLGPRDNIDVQSFIWIVGIYQK